VHLEDDEGDEGDEGDADDEGDEGDEDDEGDEGDEGDADDEEGEGTSNATAIDLAEDAVGAANDDDDGLRGDDDLFNEQQAYVSSPLSSSAQVSPTSPCFRPRRPRTLFGGGA
jgi:hypothetical protein